MADRRAGDLFQSTDIGVPMLGIDSSGRLAPLRGGADVVATNEVHVPAAATAAVLTFAAETDTAHVVWDICWSYSAAPTGGRLTIADGSDTVFDITITAAGPGQVQFPKGKQGRSGRAMTITLASGAGAVEGKVNASHTTVAESSDGLVDLSDEANSGLMILFF